MVLQIDDAAAVQIVIPGAITGDDSLASVENSEIADLGRRIW